MTKIDFVFEGKKLTGKVLKIKDTLWVSLNGEVFTYKPEFRNKKSHGTHIVTGSILAPMPGKIIKINTSIGQSVEVDQTLIVMEAMKMEYSLKSNKAGKVKSISCKVSDQVRLGQILIEID